jgi:CubicO group peptidase (beta-lactamase class C family)
LPPLPPLHVFCLIRYIDLLQVTSRSLCVGRSTRSEVHALSVAIAHHGQFVYRKAFGWADWSPWELAKHGEGERATPSNLFRIGSISKPITSVSIFMLIEMGRLKLDDFVFGRNGVLGFDYSTSYPDRVQRIKIEHLLTHTCGGWPSDGDDPMFFENDISQTDVIKMALHEEPLQYEPGTHWAYSNFGYCILGRVIEKLSKQTYEQFVKQNVLARCGVTDMRIAQNSASQRASGEVFYFAGQEVDPYAFNVRRLDSDGGWIATASDLVRFAMHVDGVSFTPSILEESSIRTMTEPCPISPKPRYPKGWVVAGTHWWHGGSLPGSEAMLIRTGEGFCMAGLVNTRTEGIYEALAGMLWA